MEDSNDRKVVIKDIPFGTKKQEVIDFLNSFQLDLNIMEFYVMKPKLPEHKIFTIIVFLTLKTNSERNRLMQYFNDFDAMQVVNGIPFTNSNNNTGMITFHLCLDKQPRNKIYAHSGNRKTYQNKSQFPKGGETMIPSKNESRAFMSASQFESNAKRSVVEKEFDSPKRSQFIDGTTNQKSPLSKNDTDILKTLAIEKVKWEKEKKGLLGYIKLLEETLKEKSPLLFVSQVELYEFNSDVEGLHNERVNKNKQIENAKSELEELKSAFQELNT